MGLFVFWACVAMLALTFGGYSLLLMLVALFVRRPVRKARIEPQVTFLITAYNEEKHIREKLEHTLSLDYPPDRFEIIVASDASTDATDDIVREFSDRRVRLLRHEGRIGKTAMQNESVRHASGEVIIFSDATTHFSPDVVRNIVRNYADPAVGAVGGRFEYTNPTGAPVGLGTILFWKYETFLKGLLTRIGSITGCSGCVYSVRRDLYVELPREVISDFCEPLKILEGGHRVVFEPEALAYEETTDRPKDEFSMRVRVMNRGMVGLWYLRSMLNPLRHPVLSVHLIIHKVLRWTVPLIVLAMMVANLTLLDSGIFYRLTLALALVVLLVSALAALLARRWKLPKLLWLPLYFFTLNMASLVAIWRFLSGQRATVWETVRR